MPGIEFLLVFGIWLVGGFVSGVSGIGGAMIAVPIAATFIPMHELIPLTCITNVAMDGCLACLHFRHCRMSAMLPMLLGSIPGAFAGLFALQMLSGAILQGAVGALLLCYVYWQLTFRIKAARAESWGYGGAAGFGSGLLGTAISFDGPPVGAYGLYVGWQPRVFLGTLGVFFILRGSMTCALQAGAGLYTQAVLGYALYGVPATMLGTLCAFPVIRHIPVAHFRRLLLLVIALAGLVCLWRSVS
ncbi:MAG: sulfite exporter TauE/SafE family protein [Deltaproteobacteria bacterium HGW-Deltaproteobacteria-18]|nr:MAG: sulfite exporter TauE/SafE family protein [Deltaproteobacteria bacterium HGW-Deltaproteobacteria-18]